MVDDDVPIEARLARLVRTKKIDDAGTGEVWLANSPVHGEVVVKIFDLARIDAPNLGVRVGRALPFLRDHNCTSLPKTFDGGTLDGAVFLVLERIDGTSLQTIFDANENGVDIGDAFDARGPRIESGRVDAVDAARIALAVTDALTAALAHRDLERDVATPIIHGAVSARKVLVGRSGHTTLLGLGTAPLSRTGPIVDATAFDTAAPELARGDPASAQTDVYAVGALLFRMLSAHPPVPPGSIVKRIRALVKGDHPKLLDVVEDAPPALAEIVERALSGKSADRYRTAGEMGEALNAWLSQANEAAVVSRADETLAWALGAIDEGDVESVARFAFERPELGSIPEFTHALWNAVADDLLDPLLAGQPVTRVQAILLAHLPEAAPDLIGLVADMEVDEQIRTAAARILGAMGSMDAAPFLVRCLNEPFAWLRLAAQEALAQLPTVQPIGVDKLAMRVVPCRQQWDQLKVLNDGRRQCEQCDCTCVVPSDLEQLEGEASGIAAFAHPRDASVVVMTLDRDCTLELGEVLTIGSDPDADLRHPRLDRFHAELRVISDGRAIVRRVGATVYDGDLEEIAIDIAPDDAGVRIAMGPLDFMTRPLEAVLIIHAQDGELVLQAGTSTNDANFI